MDSEFPEAEFVDDGEELIGIPLLDEEYSFWPFMGIVNETGYKTRRSNVILMAIWIGNKKPPSSKPPVGLLQNCEI